VSQVIGAASHKIKSSLFFLRTERTSRFRPYFHQSHVSVKFRMTCY